MPHSYSARSLTVLALLGTLSGVMSVLSVLLIAQLQAQQAAMREPSSGLGPGRSALVSREVTAVLLPVSAVLSALSLALNLGSAAVCLLHSYSVAELHGGDGHAHRADWFLLGVRTVQRIAIGLFCIGVSVYLAAMSIYMLLVFEVETGIASVCVLSSGVLALLLIVIHTLIGASRAAGRFHKPHVHHASYLIDPERSPGIRMSDLGLPEKPARQHSLANFPRLFSNPANMDPTPSETRVCSSDKDGHSNRTQRTVSTESGFFLGQAKPWNGVNNEMRSVLARKATVKDSTLV